MGAITESAGYKGGETRVLVDSVVGFQALIGTGHISVLKVSCFASLWSTIVSHEPDIYSPICRCACYLSRPGQRRQRLFFYVAIMLD